MSSSMLFVLAAHVVLLCAGPSRAGGLALTQQGSTHRAPPDYELVWADEFTRDGWPDPRNWTYERGFVRNQELQWYQADNAKVTDGRLIIEARRERKPNPSFAPGSTDWRRSREHVDFTSASLTTRGLRSWRYGRFEMRARIDVRAGMWPAFWTVGDSGRWPATGEIDIMEYYAGQLLANVAWAANASGTPAWDDSRKAVTELGEADWSHRFHVWRMDWDEHEIRLSVDGTLLNTTDLRQTVNGDGTGRNPLHQPHHIILNLAIGGTNGGDPAATRFPARFEIDYVRVYQRRTAAQTAPATSSAPEQRPLSARAQASIPLWAAGAPGALGTMPSDQPVITPYLPSGRANGTAVVIFPGGAYQHLSMEKEGSDVANWLAGNGVTAFVVRYRLGPTYRHPVMLADAQRAIRTVRARATEWGVDANRIGVIGFSAGGHLASTAGTHFGADAASSSDPIDRMSARPDFMLLIYPVITMRDSITHRGSRVNLIGDRPDSELVRLLSNETQVTHDTPPTFLIHSTDDKAVSVENSLLFYRALRAAGVPVEMHIFEYGGHGFGLAPSDPVLAAWTTACESWLRRHGWIGP